MNDDDDGDDDETIQLDSLRQQGIAESTISMLQEIYEEHPDSTAIVVSLLRTGWSIVPSGELVVCITMRSPTGHIEVLGHGQSILDAFEQIQLKTKNFSQLLSAMEVQ